MCCTRSNVSASRSMYSSSTPSVYGSLLPNAWSSTLPPGRKARALARDRRRIDLLARLYIHTGVLLLGKQRVSLDLDHPAWIEEARRRRAWCSRGGRRANISPWARPTSSQSAASRRKVRVRTTCSGRGARLGEGGDDDLEAAPRLAVRVCRRGAAVRHHGAGAGDEDVAAVAHRAREPDRRLEGRAGGDEAAIHTSSIARRWMKHFEQIDGWPAPFAAAGVLRDGDVVATRGPRDEVVRWASVTKLVTTLAALVAAEEGVIDLDEAAGPEGVDGPTSAGTCVGPAVRAGRADGTAGPAAGLLERRLRDARRARRGARGDAVCRLSRVRACLQPLGMRTPSCVAPRRPTCTARSTTC